MVTFVRRQSSRLSSLLARDPDQIEKEIEEKRAQQRASLVVDPYQVEIAEWAKEDARAQAVFRQKRDREARQVQQQVKDVNVATASLPSFRSSKDPDWPREEKKTTTTKVKALTPTASLPDFNSSRDENWDKAIPIAERETLPYIPDEVTYQVMQVSRSPDFNSSKDDAWLRTVERKSSTQQPSVSLQTPSVSLQTPVNAEKIRIFDGKEDLHAGLFIGNYDLIAPLGKGGFGSVWKADVFESPFTRSVALKFIEYKTWKNDEIVRELSLLRLIQHPNVVGVEGVFRYRYFLETNKQQPTKEYLVIVLPLYDSSLKQLLQKWNAQILAQKTETTKKKNGITPQADFFRRLFVVAQAFCGFEWMWDTGFVHLDIKPDNLLVKGFVLEEDEKPEKKERKGNGQKEGEVVVGDLGLNETVLGPRIGRSPDKMYTDGHRGPDSLCGLRDVNRKTDYWAFGAVIFQVYFWRQPFRSGLTLEQQMSFITKSVGVPDSFIALLQPLRERKEQKQNQTKKKNTKGLRPRELNLAEAVKPKYVPYLAQTCAQLLHKEINNNRAQGEARGNKSWEDVLLAPEEKRQAIEYYGTTFYRAIWLALNDFWKVNPQERSDAGCKALIALGHFTGCKKRDPEVTVVQHLETPDFDGNKMIEAREVTESTRELAQVMWSNLPFFMRQDKNRLNVLRLAIKLMNDRSVAADENPRYTTEEEETDLLNALDNNPWKGYIWG